MKKYVYTKGDERITVETDGFGSISNFMITGLIGENFSGLVQAGFNLQTGYSATIAEMMNLAKVCKCQLVCYDGDKVVEDESVDFTEETPETYSVYGITNSYPENMVANTDYQATSTLATQEAGTKGYDKVRILFGTTSPEGGHCLIKMKDTNETEFSFSDNGAWGPESGFPLPADYNVTSEMTINYSQAGTYIHTIKVVNLENNDVIAEAMTTVSVA